MAKHVAHLFIRSVCFCKCLEIISFNPVFIYHRDTVSLFTEKVDPTDDDDTDHFENIQSTNWQVLELMTNLLKDKHEVIA